MFYLINYLLFFANISICNNMTFRAESSQNGSHMTTINHNFTSSGLTFIRALGFFSSTSLSRRCLVPPHLYH